MGFGRRRVNLVKVFDGDMTHVYFVIYIRMGSQLSGNYSSIDHIFTLDMWKVHKATHKATGERVSLWVLDSEGLHKRFSKRSDRDTYFELSSASIQTMRKIRHPRVLKIIEVVEKKPEIAFAAEPIASCVVSQIDQMHPMDAAYISFQLAEVLGFLNQDARLLHMGVSPSAVLLDEEYSVKLCHFQWATPLSSAGVAIASDRLLKTSILSELQYKAPEVLAGKEVTDKSDVFSFGLFMYTAFTGQPLNTSQNAQEILAALPTRICSIYNVPGDFKQLIQSCLSLEPTSRPEFLQIMQNEGFQSMQLKSLKYMDMILTKDPQDKFKFYKGLAQKIDEFSPTLSRIKILPTLLAECKNDVRFAPVLISAILKIGETMNVDTFMKLIWQKLSFLATVVKPPEVSIALLRNLKLILEKIDKPLHKDYVYPIVIAALQSGEPRIHKECLEKIPMVIEQMSENNIRMMLLPKLLEVALSSPDPGNISSGINSVAECMKKIDQDTFAVDVIPKMQQIWAKHRSTTVAESIMKLLSNMHASSDVMMSRVIPISAEILGSHVLDDGLKASYCDWMVTTIQEFKSNKTAKFGASKASDPDNPFGTIPIAKAPPKPTVELSSSDVFGSSTPKPVQSSLNASDIFGNATSKPAQNTPTLSASDVFGSATQPKPRPMSGADIFDTPKPGPAIVDISAPSYGASTRDVFGAPAPSQAAPSNPYANPMDDIFGKSSTSSTMTGGSTDIFRTPNTFGTAPPGQTQWSNTFDPFNNGAQRGNTGQMPRQQNQGNDLLDFF